MTKKYVKIPDDLPLPRINMKLVDGKLVPEEPFPEFPEDFQIILTIKRVETNNNGV